MASKADLESREADCASIEDFVDLAKEALSEPPDKDYAKELLQKAEMLCQMPLDYVKPAEVAAQAGDTEYARDLYEQAEEMCFEVKEFIGLAHSLAVSLGDKDKARELLEKAADEASEPADLLAISNVAQKGLDDEELAKTFLAKVEEKAKGFDDFRKLAKSLKDAGDEDSARMFFKKAARFCDDIPATVGYAKEILALFDDGDWCRQTLDDAETDCQFTKEFVQLAQGYKEVLSDSEKVDALMDQAAEFCMTGEEHADLANGYWTLLQDRDKAAAAYEKALTELTDKDALLGLAKKVTTELENTELAKTIYAKAEQRMSSASELGKLAQAIVTDLNDKEYAADVYTRAAESLSNPDELLDVAGNVVTQLGDKEKASGIFRKAFEKATDYKQLLKVLGPVREKLQDTGFAREILEKAETSAEGTPQLVEVATQSLAVLEDKDMASRMLESAEERVTSLGELKSVADTIKTHFSDNADWVSRIEEKLAKREANQAKYTSFQEREKVAERPLELIRLADAVMEALDDRFYARKLLTAAEQMLDEADADFSQRREQVLAVDKHLADPDWVKRLLESASQQSTQFAELRTVGQTACKELSDKSSGKALAKQLYQAWEQRLDGAEDKSAYDYTKLAVAASEDLGDTDWAASLIEKAAALGGDHFAYAHMGALAAKLGKSELANSLFSQAADACESPEHCAQLARRLKAKGIDSGLVNELYNRAKDRFSQPAERLTWAEGIVELFKDREWAAREYTALAEQVSSEPDKARLLASRRSRLEERLW